MRAPGTVKVTICSSKHLRCCCVPKTGLPLLQLHQLMIADQEFTALKEALERQQQCFVDTPAPQDYAACQQQERSVCLVALAPAHQVGPVCCRFSLFASPEGTSMLPAEVCTLI